MLHRRLRPPLRLAALFLGVLVLLCVSKETIVWPDTIGYTGPLLSLVHDGDLHLRNQMEPYLGDPFALRWIHVQPETHYFAVESFLLGSSVPWAPFVLAGAALRSALVSAGLPLPEYQVAGRQPYFPFAKILQVAALFFCVLTVRYGIACAERIRERSGRPDLPALSAAERTLLAMIPVLGTPYFYYVNFNPLVVHAGSAFSVAQYLYAWLRHRELRTDASFTVLGCAAGLMVAMSAPNALFLVLVAGDALLARRLPGLRGALGFGLGALLMLAPQLSWWWIVEGKPLVAPIHEMHLKFLSWNALKVLFSWNHGLFTWSPAWGLGVGVLGFWALRKTESRESRGVAVGLLVCLALQVYANGTHRWWGGTGFGARRLVDSFPILLIAFVYGFPLLPRTTRRWLLALSLACVAWTVSLFLLYQTREIERSGPVFPAEALAGIRHLGSGANPLVSRHLLPFLSYSAPQWGFVGVAAALGAALLYFALYGRPYRPVLASLVITALGLAAALWLAHARTDPSSLLAPREIAALGRIEKLEKQLREAPADAATLRQLVRLELALGLDEEAAIHAGRLFAQDPADPANRSVMLAALLTLERWSAAAELVEVQLSERPDDANLLQLREELRAASARFEDL